MQVNDTIMFDIETGKIKDFIKFDVGQLVMITGGHNQGRVGTIVSRQRHKGSFDIILVKDSVGHEFATRWVQSTELLFLPCRQCASCVTCEPPLSRRSAVAQHSMPACLLDVRLLSTSAVLRPSRASGCHQVKGARQDAVRCGAEH